MDKYLKKPFLIITYAIILYFVVNNLSTFLGYIESGIEILTPVIIGISLAFIINLILRIYEKRIFDNIFKKKNEKFENIKRPLCVILSYLTFAGIVYIILNFISPRIAESVKTLTNNIPVYMDSVSALLRDITIQYDFANELWSKILENLGVIITNTSQLLNTALPKIFNITKTVTTSVFDVFVGIVFSVYILLSKEKLVRIFDKVIFAHFSKEQGNNIIRIINHANKVFRSFIGGQLTEAVILGVLCYIGMSIFRMPYAPLVSVIIGISSLVPVIGAIVGTIPCALLILFESPVMALWFVLFIIILQQVEGNVIYPKVVGSAIGLSGFWVLLAVTIGGGLFGVMGILLGVPIMAVVYSLYGNYVNKKIALKNIKPQ